MQTEVQTICKLCDRIYIYNKKAGHTTTKCNSCSVGLRRYKNKERNVAYKGGKCERCGYCKSVWALDFHHIDPVTKNFNLGSAFSRSWEVIKAELDKCILLCANCHREEHHSQSTQTEVSKFWEPRKPSIATAVCKTCGGKKGKQLHVEVCAKCAMTAREKIQWPSMEELQKLVWEMATVQLAKQLGVSDKAIEKRCKKLGVSKPPRGYWAKL